MFSLIAEVAGVYYMIDSSINNTGEFMRGFTLFSLGAILFITTSIAYLVTKAIANTEKIADSLTKLMEYFIEKDSTERVRSSLFPPNSKNPLMDLFKDFPGGQFGSTTVNISAIDEDGNVSPLTTKSFDNIEDFFKHRDEIIAEAFGTKPKDVKKKLDEMSIEELKEKEKQAANEEQWDLAAAYRDAIWRKNKS